MFFRRRTKPKPARRRTVDEELRSVIREHLPAAEEAEVEIVWAVGGLLGAVAYADRDYTDEEAALVRSLLSRMHDVPPAAIDAIAAVLSARIRELAHGELQRYARVLQEETEPEARIEILEVLMEVAAADGRVTLDETNLLRRVAAMLGLGPHEYVAAQERHRDKLTVLE